MEFGEYFRDLARLDPREDPERWERMVAAIMAAAQPELARRAARPDPGLTQLLSSWVRPALSAAAALAAMAATVLLLQRQPAVAQASATTLNALGYPETVATYVETGQARSLDELTVALEGVNP
ncbi:MAG TPA: hypothetical protein VFQ38_22845 [Longimicrobiales bacterium]|nr:hypothetical protein [Longimicrobiales bacterium]